MLISLFADPLLFRGREVTHLGRAGLGRALQSSQKSSGHQVCLVCLVHVPHVFMAQGLLVPQTNERAHIAEGQARQPSC